MKRFSCKTNFACLIIPLLVFLQSTGCRETTSQDPPIHLNRNMDTQKKYKSQRESGFFVDGSTMRTPVEGTVARGELREDDAFERGKTAEGAYVSIPIPVTDELLARGKERYTIYCSPCHGESGNGKGKIMEYKYPVPPTSYFEPRILDARDGYLFEVISNGVRSMSSYHSQIPVRDRWSIVAYVRALQRASLPDAQKGIPNPSIPAATR